MTGTRGLVFAGVIILLLLGIVIQQRFLSSKIDDNCRVVVLKDETQVVASPSATIAPVATATPRIYRVIPTVVK